MPTLLQVSLISNQFCHIEQRHYLEWHYNFGGQDQFAKEEEGESTSE